MKNHFIKYVLSNLSDFDSVIIPSYIYRRLSDKCVELLNYDNEAVLRANHEGFRFMRRFSKDFLGLYSLKKHLGMDISNEIENAKINFTKSIKINDIEYNVIVFDFFTMPRLEEKMISNTIFIIRHSNQKFFICGKISRNQILKYLSKEAIFSSITNEGYTSFIGFNELKRLDD